MVYSVIWDATITLVKPIVRTRWCSLIPKHRVIRIKVFLYQMQGIVHYSTLFVAGDVVNAKWCSWTFTFYALFCRFCQSADKLSRYVAEQLIKCPLSYYCLQWQNPWWWPDNQWVPLFMQHVSLLSPAKVNSFNDYIIHRIK